MPRRVGGALAAAFVIALMAAAPAPAVPHLISNPDHPYDPDWPVVRHFLLTKCVGCHRPGTERTDFTSYASFIAAEADDLPIVSPGDLEDSLIWEYVAWNATADTHSDLADQPEMPPEQMEWLSAGQLAALRRWIERGCREYQPGREHERVVTEMDFPSAKQCKACHPRQYDEWSRSMHAYAQHSPIFEAFNLTMQERTGGTIGTFCSRCHTPIGTSLGEDGRRTNVCRSRLSTEGITCVVCHRRSAARYKSNARISIEPSRLAHACMYGPFDDPVSLEHKAHPSMGLPYIKTSQFCGECHDVTSPDGVRLEEAFSEWQNSPAAARRQSCQNCHMGPVQGQPTRRCDRPLGPAAEPPGVPLEKMPQRRLSSHLFAGPDYSLLPDTEFPFKLDWQYETDYRNPDRLTPHQQRTLAKLRRINRESLKKADAGRYALLGNSAELCVRAPKSAACGETIQVRVDVRSKTSGHSLPTGFTAERQVWVYLELRDPAGRIVFVSGDLDSNQDLRDDHSHDVLAGHRLADAFLLNFQNKFYALSNKGTERSVVLSVNRHLQPINVLRPARGIAASFGRPPGFRIAKGSLPPEKTLGRTYPIPLPRQAGPYRLQVRLQFRHLPPALLDHIGAPHLKHQLEVVVMEQFDAVVSVAGPKDGYEAAHPRWRIPAR